jgi:phage-related protein
MPQGGILKMFRIEFFKDKAGNEPIVDYIRKLNEKALTSKEHRTRHKKIMEYLEVLSQYGTRAGEPYVKHIDGGIWELRPTNDRVFFFYWKAETYVMLHHFVKKTQKTPDREIKQAKRNLMDFLERSEDNE